MAQPTPTDPWSEADPVGSDAISTVDDAINRFERRVRERLNYGGHSYNNTTLAEAALHCIGHGSGETGVGKTDGVFTIFAIDRTTPVVQITDVTFATVADRNRMILDGTIIKGFKNIAGVYESNVADGASAVAFDFNNLIALSTAGAKLVRIRNDGVEKLAILDDGNLLPIGDWVVRDSGDANDNLKIDDATGDLTMRGKIVAGGDIEAAGGFRCLIPGWTRQDQPATLGNSQMHRFVESSGMTYATPARVGSVIGISVTARLPVTAGTITFELHNGGAPQGLTVELDSVDALYNSTTQAKNLDTFTAKDNIGILVKSSGLAPTTNDYEAFLEIET